MSSPFFTPPPHSPGNVYSRWAHTTLAAPVTSRYL